MKWLFLLLILVAPAVACAQSAADTEAIREAALDYIEGWYAGDAERMERALHPDLVKRIVQARGEQSSIDQVGAADLIASTASGGGRGTPTDVRRSEVTILDTFGNTASVRVDAHAWIDYMHLARFDGQWKIVNVLWEIRGTE